MDELRKGLWLAEFTWRAWKAAKRELEQELGCEIEKLGFTAGGVFASTAIDAMFHASASEIQERAKVEGLWQATYGTFESWRKSRGYGEAQTENEHAEMMAEFKRQGGK